MRHEKALAIVELARRLASSAEGMTLDEIASDCGVHRRTAERMLDAIEMIYPSLEQIADPPFKRYRITGGLEAFAQAPSTEELHELSSAAAAYRAAGATQRADALESLERKVRSAMRGAVLRRLAPDVEALARSETIAVQAGPGPLQDRTLVSSLRQALLSMRRVSFTYDGGSRRGERRQAIPYGLVFGRHVYLVAADAGAAKPKSFRLDRIGALEVSDEPGAPPAGFDLAEYGARSFGVYQGEIEAVRLRAAPTAAHDARNWRFHHDQVVEEMPDGSVEVSFLSSGMLELAWHIITWRDTIEVLAPDVLKQILRAELASSLRHHDVDATGSVVSLP